MKAKTNNPDPVKFAKALADPTRQEIMNITCCEWLNVTEIVESVGVSQPTVSHHLNILKDAGLVEVRNEGKHTFYTINQERVAYCCGMLISEFAPETDAAESVKLEQ